MEDSTEAENGLGITKSELSPRRLCDGNAKWRSIWLVYMLCRADRKDSKNSSKESKPKGLWEVVKRVERVSMKKRRKCDRGLWDGL